ncbi:hypothetical protein HHI36_021275 [Cryptolaemus montrouzieri]|uniref:NADAR domain-containing protein n=1 Tax=Cryptolaemus montrouzieri TaxID=559131 RepID=A0ABD2MW88_9CUCU
MAIRDFRREYRFLSNFYGCASEYEGLKYPSTEHAFQAAKTSDIEERKKIISFASPFEAKRVGQTVKLRSDWEEVKYDIMLELVRQKFQYPELKKMLLDTGTSDLIEENTWHDNFFGICLCEKCKAVGKNNLGLILQQVRSELKTENC